MILQDAYIRCDYPKCENEIAIRIGHETEIPAKLEKQGWRALPCYGFSYMEGRSFFGIKVSSGYKRNVLIGTIHQCPEHRSPEVIDSFDRIEFPDRPLMDDKERTFDLASMPEFIRPVDKQGGGIYHGLTRMPTLKDRP